MEGDAGASRLNPADTDDSSSEPHEAEQTSTETTAEGLVETEAEDVSEAEVDSTLRRKPRMYPRLKST